MRDPSCSWETGLTFDKRRRTAHPTLPSVEAKERELEAHTMLAACRCPTGVLQAAALLLLACLSSTAQPAEGVCNIAKLSSVRRPTPIHLRPSADHAQPQAGAGVRLRTRAAPIPA